jgi:carbon storage regulator
VLVLSRKPGEAIRIGSALTVRVVSVAGGRVRLAIDAPADVAVHREEIVQRIAEANRAAAHSEPASLARLLGEADDAPGSGPEALEGGRPWNA